MFTCHSLNSLNSLNNSNSGAFGGPWPGLHGPSGHYMGPDGCSSTRNVTKWSSKPIQKATEGAWGKSLFESKAKGKFPWARYAGVSR